jgi:hypothetical protein
MERREAAQVKDAADKVKRKERKAAKKVKVRRCKL